MYHMPNSYYYNKILLIIKNFNIMHYKVYGFMVYNILVGMYIFILFN